MTPATAIRCHERPEPRPPILLERAIPGPVQGEPSDDNLLTLVEATLSPIECGELDCLLRPYPYTADRRAVLRAALEEANVLQKESPLLTKRAS